MRKDIRENTVRFLSTDVTVLMLEEVGKKQVSEKYRVRLRLVKSNQNSPMVVYIGECLFVRVRRGV